jgi:Na+/H+-dicarboxylate symporter
MAIDLGLGVFFGIMRMVVEVPPIGAFGAMAISIGIQGAFLGAAARPEAKVSLFFGVHDC